MSEAPSKFNGGAIPKTVSWNENKNNWTRYNHAEANGHNSANAAHDTFQFEMPAGQDSNERKQFSFGPSSIYKQRPGPAPKKAQWNAEVNGQAKASRMQSMSMSSETKTKGNRGYCNYYLYLKHLDIKRKYTQLKLL